LPQGAVVYRGPHVEVYLDRKNLDFSNFLDTENTNAEDLGPANLASITLKGTITATYNNQPAPLVEMRADTSLRWGIGFTYPRLCTIVPKIVE
jgi:hypothetical protein